MIRLSHLNATIVLAVIIACAKSGYYLVLAIFPIAVAATHARPVAQRVCLAVTFVMLNQFAVWESAWLNEHLSTKVLTNYFPLFGLVLLGAFLALALRQPSKTS